MTKRRKARESNIVDTILPEDAKAILRIMCEESDEIADLVKDMVVERLSDPDIEDVACIVFDDLDCLDVHEVWDSSGSTSDGYIAPGDYAWEMFERAVEPHISGALRRLKVVSAEDSMKYTMGVLLGIYRFEEESKSEFKDWAVDAPGEFFRRIYNDWKKGCRNKRSLRKMETFIEDKCPGWLR